jgi:ferredoxin
MERIKPHPTSRREVKPMKRTIIKIDEEKCTGCGLCIPNCPEGAIQVIDGKARLVSELLCDGLGACLGHCPEGAITTETRNAEAYDERRVMENIVKQGANTVKAHLDHLKTHGLDDDYNQAVAYLSDRNVPVPESGETAETRGLSSGCPGSRSMAFARQEPVREHLEVKRPSQLTHWPIQMHLLSPDAPHYRGADMLLAADCVAYTLGGFHEDHLRGRVLGIACPKLDQGKDIYLEKLKALIDVARINTLTIITMEVPCCRGLLELTREARGRARRKIPITSVVVGIHGDILGEEQI